MSSDSDDGIYARSNKRHQEFTAKTIASTRPIGHMIQNVKQAVETEMAKPTNGATATSFEEISGDDIDSEDEVKDLYAEAKKKKAKDMEKFRMRKKIVNVSRKQKGRKDCNISDSESDSEKRKEEKPEVKSPVCDSSSCDDDYPSHQEEETLDSLASVIEAVAKSAMPLQEMPPTPEDMPMTGRGRKRGGGQRGGRKSRGRGGKQQRVDPPQPSAPAGPDFFALTQAAERLQESCGRAMLAVEKSRIQQEVDNTHNLSCGRLDDDDEEQEVVVKVRWNMELVKLEILKNQRFGAIYDHFANFADVPKKRILLTLKDKPVLENDTPDSINFNPVIDILVGGIINEIAEPASAPSAPVANPNEIELKVQSSDRKKTHTMKMMKDGPMSELMKKYADLVGKNLNQLKFKFDGEMLDMDSTPVDLDLDGGECIDVYYLD